jgi:plastocyanin
VQAHAAPPSPWPFFVPVGIGVAFVGLGVASMAFVVAGLVMVVLALLGWYRDAGQEWRATEDGVKADSSNETRPDAEPPLADRAGHHFPGWLLGVYGILFLMATLITVGGWSIDTTSAAVRAQAAPSSSAGGPGGLAVVAQNIQFSPTKVTAPAGTPFDITFENKDKIPHNWAVYPSATDPAELFKGDIVTGPTVVTYHVPALKAGTYQFRCDVHPASMFGTLVVGG